MNRQILLKISLTILISIGLFSFQEEKGEPLSDEAAIEAAVQKKINDLKLKQHWECQAIALKKAIPIADSMIAEMYARDLRASDILLKRPKRPARPRVELEPFPFDSIK
jgi:hypothetical protein